MKSNVSAPMSIEAHKKREACEGLSVRAGARHFDKKKQNFEDNYALKEHKT